ncbi:hypothetical protein NMG60_11002781 [Bertholletia excelsa]
MAAFTQQQQRHRPFPLDPVFQPNIPNKLPESSQEVNTITSMATSFPQFCPSESLQQIPLEDILHESSCLDSGSKATFSYNGPSPTNKHSSDSSISVSDRPQWSEQVSESKVYPMNTKRKSRNCSVQSMEAREAKGKRQKKRTSVEVKKEEDRQEKNNKANNKADKKKDRSKKALQEPPTGYIHVRARRGEATDSHSLAERVRREKISERMKLLQALVPGCDKVTGKALVLEEIINYIQSLQNQVEFLSMKIASLTPMFYDFGMDLDAFMANPEGVNSVLSPLPNMEQPNYDQANGFSSAATILPTPSSYPLLDNSSSLLLDPQVESSNILPQDNGQLLWDVDHQRQTLINQSGFANNMCFFH